VLELNEILAQTYYASSITGCTREQGKYLIMHCKDKMLEEKSTWPNSVHHPKALTGIAGMATA
jgi:hypothetical protein